MQLVKSLLQVQLSKYVPSIIYKEPYFDPFWYSLKYSALSEKEFNPLDHYMRHGWQEGRKPNPLFDPIWYLSEYPDVQATGLDPLAHYIIFGWRERRNPGPRFDVKDYLSRYHDVIPEETDPLQYFLQYGYQHGYLPRPVSDTNSESHEGQESISETNASCLNENDFKNFEPDYYRMLYPDLQLMTEEEALHHYYKYGYWEGRIIAPVHHRNFTPQEPAEESSGKSKPIICAGGIQQFSSPLIIAGFHRSGTSLTANLFANAGLELGEKLLGAMPSNPLGHFEDTSVIAFHDKLLEQSGACWQTDKSFFPVMHDEDWEWLKEYGIKSSLYPAWGIKDPRVCLFLPQWAKTFPSMSVLYIFRPCIECVHSLKRRAARDLQNGVAQTINQRFWTVEDLAIKMYIIYAKAALDFLEKFPGRSRVVTLQDLLSNVDIVRDVRKHWGYRLGRGFIGDIYDKSFLSLTGPNEVVHDSALLQEVEELETKLLQRSELGFVDGTTS
jgi:hypothetical protein